MALATTDCVVSVEQSRPPLVVVTGEVNFESAPRIREAFQCLLDREGHKDVVLDCSSVDFIDSSGIGAIVHIAQKLRHNGGSLTLQAATPQLMHALEVSGFSDLVDTCTVAPCEPRGGRKSDSAGESQDVSFSIPVAADRDGLVRRKVTDIAQSLPFTSDQIDDIRLAVGEAASNAVRHGCKDKDRDHLIVRCTSDPEKLCVEIHNPGCTFDPDSIPEPDPDNPNPGGFGIYFMKKTMDCVEFHFDDTGTTVSLVKYVRKDCAER